MHFGRFSPSLDFPDPEEFLNRFGLISPKEMGVCLLHMLCDSPGLIISEVVHVRFELLAASKAIPGIPKVPNRSMFKEGRHVLDGGILTKHFVHKGNHGSVCNTVLLELIFVELRMDKFEEDWLIG